MAKTFKLTVKTPDPESLFKDAVDYKRFSKGKTINSLATHYIKKHAQDKLSDLMEKKAASKGSRSVSKEIRTEVNRVQTKAAASGMGKTLPVKIKAITPPESYIVVAQFFFRIVARTPYDEEYEYIRKFQYRSAKLYKDTAFIVQKHIPDDDVVKNEWHIKVTNKEGKSFESTSEELMNIYDFETIKNQDYFELAAMIGQELEFIPIRSVNIWNTNPRVDQLEFGRYKKKNIKGQDEVHKGENRYHGTHYGYSVQAPRGFIALTSSEFREATFEDPYNGELVAWPDKFGFNVTMSTNKRLSSELWKIVRERKGFIFDEKEILQALLEDKKSKLSLDDIVKKRLDEVAKKEVSLVKKGVNKLSSELSTKQKAENSKVVGQKKVNDKSSDIEIKIDTPSGAESVSIKNKTQYKDFLSSLTENGSLVTYKTAVGVKEVYYGLVDLDDGIGDRLAKIEDGEFYFSGQMANSEMTSLVNKLEKIAQYNPKLGIGQQMLEPKVNWEKLDFDTDGYFKFVSSQIEDSFMGAF